MCIKLNIHWPSYTRDGLPVVFIKLHLACPTLCLSLFFFFFFGFLLLLLHLLGDPHVCRWMLWLLPSSTCSRLPGWSTSESIDCLDYRIIKNAASSILPSHVHVHRHRRRRSSKEVDKWKDDWVDHPQCILRWSFSHTEPVNLSPPSYVLSIHNPINFPLHSPTTRCFPFVTQAQLNTFPSPTVSRRMDNVLWQRVWWVNYDDHYYYLPSVSLFLLQITTTLRRSLIRRRDVVITCCWLVGWPVSVKVAFQSLSLAI